MAKRPSTTPGARLRASCRIPFCRGKRLPPPVLQLRRSTAILRAARAFISIVSYSLSSYCTTSATTHNFFSSRLYRASTLQPTCHSYGQRASYLFRLSTARPHQAKLPGHQQIKDVNYYTNFVIQSISNYKGQINLKLLHRYNFYLSYRTFNSNNK